jgi:vancomycin resistance protein YoaR
MHVPIARAAGVLLTALLATPLMAAAQTAPAQSAERSRTQGIKETDRFIKAGNNAHASIANARVETKNTLDRYNKLVTQPSKNMKGDYKKLLGAVDDMNEEIADAKLEVTNMRASGDTYFTGRETTNKTIQDQQLQSSAATRLATSRKDFDTVLASLHAAEDALETFRKALADQVTFLGSDLTPTAMTALKPAADKLNAQGDEALSKIDAANAALRAYLDGLKATQS